MSSEHGDSEPGQDEQATKVYQRLVSETDVPEHGVMVSESENGVAVVHATPGVSGVLSALRDLGYESIGASGGGEFPDQFHIKEAP